MQKVKKEANGYINGHTHAGLYECNPKYTEGDIHFSHKNNLWFLYRMWAEETIGEEILLRLRKK